MSAFGFLQKSLRTTAGFLQKGLRTVGGFCRKSLRTVRAFVRRRAEESRAAVSRYGKGAARVTFVQLGGAAAGLFAVCLIFCMPRPEEQSGGINGIQQAEAAAEALLETVPEPQESYVLTSAGTVLSRSDSRVLEGTTAWVSEFGRINIREDADFDSRVLDCVVYGDRVYIYEEKGEFTHVSFVSPLSGETVDGYCYTAFLSETQPGGPQMYLNVPLFKQADPRWGQVKIGGYETLASAGCTTTCLSMSESFVTGETVYPDEVAESLYYTYDGRLTFPNRYGKYYGSDYLTQVLKNLQNGIPTLVSGYTASGKTHWVLVVGYDGDGSSLETSDFLINDPGSYRTTLDEFFRAYPLFEKIVYYAG